LANAKARGLTVCHFLIASVAIMQSLIRQLVTFLPSGFPILTAKEIAIRHESLDESSLRQDQALVTIGEEIRNDPEPYKSNSGCDRDGQCVIPRAKYTKHPVLPPVSDFKFDDASRLADLAFCDVSNTPDLQNASCFCEQVGVSVEYMRADRVSKPFTSRYPDTRPSWT
jgi:hypothetical protein